jgi:hypothetical protein
MFALAEAFDKPLQISFTRPVEQRFDAFLKVCPLSFRAMRKVVAKETSFCAYLIGGKKQGHYGDAHDQGQDNLQCRSHLHPRREYMGKAARGWVPAASSKEL